jgi:hypothetical protein
MPYYKAEVMRLHNITSGEYDSRTIEGDRSIYLPQPNPMFEPTHFDERVAHALGLDYQELQDKFKQGELEHKIAGCDSTGRDNRWRDEDPNRCVLDQLVKIELQHTQSEARGGNMFVISVLFSTYLKGMLAELLEYRNDYMSINPRF